MWHMLGEIKPQPEGMEYCSDCGDWRARSFFSPDPKRKRGVAYVCKQCRNERERGKRVDMAMEQGREVRRYYKPKAA